MKLAKLTLAAFAMSAVGLSGSVAMAQDMHHHDMGDHDRTVVRTVVTHHDNDRDRRWHRDHDRGHHYGWRNHHRTRVCRTTWRHHHRVRVCTWRRW